ncbi:spore gernimation protein GerA [Vulcanibacillus modesticaldus]|uniref:Spore gernimation protein GerA n=1 Tax=Vulcanibacillus modesticaldus TaxID=337097 RepID=A0A1D2YUE2_9BACI|nr:spore germination protein [Vulcanibacillus modesticaldus]OEF99309.1 spore gernimation protein GerA [Vulcanibacillus modesticaldus]
MTIQQKLESKKVSKNLAENVLFMNEILGVDKSFDVIYRKLHYAGKEFALYFVDGFAKDDIMNYIMIHLSQREWEELVPNTLKHLLETEIGYLEVETSDDFKQIVTQVLSGPLALFVDGEDEAILIDARTYPARGPQEPDIERVVRGSRDGFVETLIFNTALTRRRLRDPSLRMEYMQVGERSKTDIAIAYIEDIANPDLVERIKKKLDNAEIDGLPMAEKTLEEYLFSNHWNPYPMVRFTERPDVAAVHLLEGHVLIYVDTSPSVMITPTTLFHHVQHAEEYRQKPIIGAYLRWIRFFAMILSVILLPLWFLVVQNPSLLPENLKYIGPNKIGQISIFWQFIFAELGVDILRMAAVHTPSPLATALGLISAIIIGQMAIDVGLFTKEVILYLAIATIGTFATPSYELSMANRLVRIYLLIMVFVLGKWGFIIGILLWFLFLVFSKSFDTPYLWPLIPFNGKALLDVIVRSPMPYKNKRPKILSPDDPDRSPGE